MTSFNKSMVFSRFAFSRYLLASLFLLTFTLVARAQGTANDAAEKGKFRLHKSAQAIGEESYSLERSAGSITLSSRFLFTDRGTQVPLDGKFTAAADYRPQSFTLRGQTCRFCPIDWDIRIENGNARIRLEKQTNDAPLPAAFFTTAGYAPVAMQMAMM